MSPTFTHLHLHSQYSLLDGAIRLKDLFPRLNEFGMTSVALTDHGNMFGALDFYKAARKSGVKPIFGCEVYITDRDRGDRSERRSFHFILLAKTLQGYQNLAYLVSKAYLEGFYYVPRIDKELLKGRTDGLVALSACLGGEVAQGLFKQGTSRAEEIAREYKSMFEPGSFFLEVQANTLDQQNELNEYLEKLSAKINVPLVATNDCHYLERKDARAHDCLMCVQTGKLLSDTNRMKHDVDEYFLKSSAEMEQAFYHLPQAIENTIKIADMCNVELDLSQTFLPKFQVPKGSDLEPYLQQQVEDGLKRRFREMRDMGKTPDEKSYRARVAHELSVIQRMGFTSYFLIVWDFINHAKESGIPVGPGRGSGAGSLVAYALRITDIDPLPFNLLFERFLNPERVSMPDFDIDFCMHRRDEVIEYVTEKYGEDNVGQIVTMHQLKARGVTRDVARVMGVSYGEADRVAKLIPEPIQGRSVSIPEALEQEPRLKELADENAQIADLLDVATALEGLNRHAGTHAAGLVIGEKPLWEYVPCFGQKGQLVTQYAKDEVEEAGLVKFDFLGLKTLTVLDHAQRLARRDNPDLNIDLLPIDDMPTFEMIQAGHTTGVFQMESSGFKELLKRLQPDCFEDIVAAVALYRPGPLEGGMVDDFVERKHGRTAVEYLHPTLEDILKETYGVIVYQEQVMQIASVLSGYSLGDADLLRRAMGKKKAAEMAKQEKMFLAGAEKNSIDAALAKQIFDLMAAFAGYGFNKSHSVAYAWISYQTAYLKCHYPEEFMAAVLTCDKDNSDNLTKYINETRKSMNIPVLRPDVNESEADFSVIKRGEQKFIRFGLGAVRNVGDGAVESIVEARDEGPYTGLFDFCHRIDSRKVNKRVLEALIKAGAFDEVAQKLEVNRAQLMAAADAAQERAMAAQKDRQSGQTNLFGLLQAGPGGAAPANEVEEIYADLPDWDERQKLGYERENLGFYVSGHPLDRYEADLKRHASASIGTLSNLGERAEVNIGGLIASYKERPLRSGKGRMAIFNLEDRVGHVEVVCFSKAFEQYEDVLKAGEPVLLKARVRFEGEGEDRNPRLQMNEAVTLADLRERETSEIHLHLDSEKVEQVTLDRLKALLRMHVGDCRTLIHMRIPGRSTTVLELSERYSVNPSEELLFALEQLFGKDIAHLR